MGQRVVAWCDHCGADNVPLQPIRAGEDRQLCAPCVRIWHTTIRNFFSARTRHVEDYLVDIER